MTSTPTTPDPTTQTHPVCVVDAASLKFRFGPARRTVSALSATGQHLATLDLPKGASAELAAWLAMRDIVAHAQVLAPDATGALVGHAVALYNPFTAQTSWVTPHGTDVTLAGRPIALAAGGTTAVVTWHDDTWELRDHAGRTLAAAIQPDAESVTRALAAHG